MMSWPYVMAPKEKKLVRKKSVVKKATSGPSFKCKKCGKELGSAKSYQGHLNLHAGKRPFKCFLCTKAYPSNNSLGKHVRLEHVKTSSRHTSSQSAARGPPSTKSLPPVATKRPKDSNSSRRFPCGVCGKSLASLATYRNHVNRHAKKGRHKCSQCGREYPTATTLRLHEKAKHEKCLKQESGAARRHVERPFKCRHCVGRFTSAESLKKHQEQSHGPCAVCGRFLSSGVAYRAHMSRHSGQRSFKCGHCSKTFFSTKSQREHERYAHGVVRRAKGPKSGGTLKKQGPSSRPRGRPKGTVSHKELKCRHCGKVLASVAAYKSHMSMHRGSLPYKCGQCSKSYSHVGTLRKHERLKHSLTSRVDRRTPHKTDEDQQPSQHVSPASAKLPQSHGNFCKKCRRVLSGPREYESHMNRHAGIQPYKCSQCGLSYHGIRSLKKHIDDKHKSTSTPQESGGKHQIVKHQPRKGRTKHAKKHQLKKKKEHLNKNCSKKEQPKEEQASRQQSIPEEERKESPRKDDAASWQLEVEAVESGKDLPHSASPKRQSPVEHAGPGSFQCGLCGAVLERYAGYMAHMTQHSGQHSHSCGGACPSPASLREHQQSQHPPASHSLRLASQPFKCAVCGDVLSSAAAHEAHMKSHVNRKPFACSLCTKAYSRADTLKKHMRIKHYSPPRRQSQRQAKHSCSSQTEPLWTNHLRTDTLVHLKHSSPPPDHCPTDPTPSDSAPPQAPPTVPSESTHTHKPTPSQARKCFLDLKCFFCNNSFRRPSEMYWHVFSHKSLQPFACSECHLQHFSAKTIRRHQKGHDAGNMAICCSLCWKFQSRKCQTVLNHLLSEHRDQLEQQYGIPVPENLKEMELPCTDQEPAPQPEEESVKSESVDTSCMFEVVEMGGEGEAGKTQVVTFESCGGEEEGGEEEEVVPVCGEVQVGESSSEDLTATPSKSDTILVKYGSWNVFFFKDV